MPTNITFTLLSFLSFAACLVFGQNFYPNYFYPENSRLDQYRNSIFQGVDSSTLFVGLALLFTLLMNMSDDNTTTTTSAPIVMGRRKRDVHEYYTTPIPVKITNDEK